MSGQREYTTAADARAHRSALADDWTAHRKICATCILRPGHPPRWCDEGWKIASGIARAGSAIRGFGDQAEAEQGTLF